MSEEQVKILRMLSEGKISAEQAERLLSAVAGPEVSAAGRTPAAESVAKMGELVGRMFSGKGGPRSWGRSADEAEGDPMSGPEQVFAVSPGARFVIRSRGGSVRVLRGDQEGVAKVIASNPEGASVRHTDGEHVVRTRGGSLEARLPAIASLELSVAGGDVSVEGLRTDIGVDVGGGNLTTRGCTGRLTVKAMGGNADIEGEITGISLTCMGGGVRASGLQIVEGEHSIRAMGGSVSLAVLPASSLTVRAKAFGGVVACDAPGSPGGQGEYKFGNGAAVLDVKAFGGNVDIRRAG